MFVVWLFGIRHLHILLVIKNVHILFFFFRNNSTLFVTSKLLIYSVKTCVCIWDKTNFYFILNCSKTLSKTLHELLVLILFWINARLFPVTLKIIVILFYVQWFWLNIIYMYCNRSRDKDWAFQKVMNSQEQLSLIF